MLQSGLKSQKRIKPAQIFRNNYQIYTLMLPAIVATFVFAYIPIYGVQIAFKDFSGSRGIWGSPWVGFKHFIRFITFPNFWQMMTNTLSITGYTLAVFPLTVIVALMLNELQGRRFKRTVQMISYAPHFLSVVVLCGLVKLFLDRGNGILNNVLLLLRGGERIDFLSKPQYFSTIYVWSGVWQDIGWGTIIYLAALSGVSPELLEAAEIDGAGRLRIIWSVKLPCITPTIIILFIMATGSIMSVGFEKIFLLENKLNQNATRVISTYVYRIGLENGQFSYASAISLFNNVINLLVLLFVNTIIKRGSGVGLW